MASYSTAPLAGLTNIVYQGLSMQGALYTVGLAAGKLGYDIVRSAVSPILAKVPIPGFIWGSVLAAGESALDNFYYNGFFNTNAVKTTSV